MSAWIVSRGHVDCIVQAAIVEGLATFDQADALGRQLWEANWLGFDYNYGGRYPEDRPAFESYTFAGIEAPLDDFVVHRQLRCFNYQSCDRDEWEGSPENVLVDALCERIEARHPDVDLMDIDDLPWGIESIDEAVARVSA